MIGAAPPRGPGPRPWWEGRPFLLLLILLSAVPLLYPPLPPLVDLLGHMGRFRVQLDLGTSPWLHRYYEFEWAAIGNLGLDLLIIPLEPLVGLENAVKLIVICIPPLTVAGFLWVAREVHNRIPPTALFALPFAYGHPFLFGFANFALSMALALLAFGLWLRLGRLGRTRLRAILFVPISIGIFFVHTFGWGTLGLLAFSADAVREHDRGQSWIRAGVRAATHAAVMALPLAIMFAWRSDVRGGMTGDWFNWDAKLYWLMMALRDRWQAFDLLSMAAVGAVLVFALANRRLGFSRNLAFSALVLVAGFILLPRIIFGSAYADMRLVPYMIATALLAVRFREATHRPTAQILAVLGLGFYLIRIAATTVSLALSSGQQQAKLEALEHVPMGAAVATLVARPCEMEWALLRDSHLGAMVIVRRHGFSNDQWVLEGMNLLRLRYREAGPFASDPSQLVRPAHCAGPPRWDVEQALGALPRGAFDYVWMVDALTADPRLLSGLRPVWRGEDSILYAVSRAGAAPPAATLRRETEPARSGATPARRSGEARR